jgi:type I restriction enzyme M protein
MVSRTNRELSAEDIGRIADTYRAWRGEDPDLKRYGDVPGFPYGDVPGLCAAADLDAIRDHNHVLIPGQCIGSEPVEAMGNRWTRRSLG